MKWLITLFAAFQAVVFPSAVLAQNGAAHRTVLVESWEEEWDPATQRWVRVTEVAHQPSSARPHQAMRFSVPQAPTPSRQALAQYGPFQVVNANRAAMVGPTTPMSPHHFRAMLRDFPELNVLEFIDAPGTSDDLANLEVGRMIRAANIATHVPSQGSVRSGAVELFIAGSRRTMEEGARFAVHAWLDHLGRQPADFAPGAPENRLYLDYYRDMGMTSDHASAFYAMTNSVPHHSAKWLDAGEMRAWLRSDPPPARALDRVSDRLPMVFVRAEAKSIDGPFAAPVSDGELAVETELAAPALAYRDMSVVGLSPLDS